MVVIYVTDNKLVSLQRHDNLKKKSYKGLKISRVGKLILDLNVRLKIENVGAQDEKTVFWINH